MDNSIINYAQIKADGQLKYMPNPYEVSVSNPTPTMQAQLAQMFNWLEVVYTEEPTYDPETQYVTSHFEEQGGKAVQVWEIHEIEPQTESAE